MKCRFLLAALALSVAIAEANAGPFRRRAQVQPTYYSQPTYQPVGSTCANGFCSTVSLSSVPSDSLLASPVADSLAGDGLDEVNAKRALRGLRPFVRDEGLMQAARACAAFRASRLLFGHTGNDFAFVPSGTSASAAGCAAYPASYGWLSCAVYDGYTFAGAAWVTGADGKRYMHLFVR